MFIGGYILIVTVKTGYQFFHSSYVRCNRHVHCLCVFFDGSPVRMVSLEQILHKLHFAMVKTCDFQRKYTCSIRSITLYYLGIYVLINVMIVI